MANHGSEFTDHQRSVFCVFSGNGVVRLRNHLSQETFDELDQDGETVADDDQTMTGMMHTTNINAEEEADADADADDDDDVDGVANNSSFGGVAT